VQLANNTHQLSYNYRVGFPSADGTLRTAVSVNQTIPLLIK
jgi:hypothetical protein